MYVCMYVHSILGTFLSLSFLLRMARPHLIAGVERGIMASLRTERDAARMDLTHVQDRLSQQVGLLQTTLANLQASAKMNTDR